jgi:hypothetical protein
VALLLTALIALTGCPTEADDDSSGGRDPNHIFGTVNVGGVQAAVNAAELSGRTLVLTDGVTIRGADGDNILDFKTANVRIDGKVTIIEKFVVIDASKAHVTWGENAQIKFGFPDDAYIYRANDRDGANLDRFDLTEGRRVPLITDIKEITGTDTAVAMDIYPVAGGKFPAHVDKLYVTDKLTKGSADLTTTSLKEILALGEVDITGNTAFTDGHKLLGTASLTSSVGAVTVTVPSETKLSGVKVEANKNITIASTKESALTIGKIEGPGGLTIGDGNVLIATITIGEISSDGRVTVSNTNGTPSIVNIPDPVNSAYYGNLTAPGNSGALIIANEVNFKTLTLKGAGTVAFNDKVTVSGTATIDNDATFAGAVDIKEANAAVTFNGNVTLSGALSSSASVSIITFGGVGPYTDASKAPTISLAAGKQISIGTQPILEAVTAVKLTGDKGVTKLTANSENIPFTAELEEDDLESYRTLKVSGDSGNGFTLTSGNLKVLSSTLDLASSAEVVVQGSLTLENIAAIKLASSTAATLKIGTTKIVGGGADGTFTSDPGDNAVTGTTSTVTFKPDAIMGAGNGSFIFVSGTNAAPVITVDPGKNLTIGGVNYNLGTSVLKAGGDQASRIILQGGAAPGILTFAEAEAITWSGNPKPIKNSAGTPAVIATLSGKDVVATATNAEEGTGAIGSISGGATDDATITTSGTTVQTFALSGDNIPNF